MRISRPSKEDTYSRSMNSCGASSNTPHSSREAPITNGGIFGVVGRMLKVQADRPTATNAATILVALLIMVRDSAPHRLCPSNQWFVEPYPVLYLPPRDGTVGLP